MKDTRGSTVIEYAMVAACIAAVLVAAVSNVGAGVLELFNRIHF